LTQLGPNWSIWLQCAVQAEHYLCWAGIYSTSFIAHLGILDVTNAGLYMEW